MGKESKRKLNKVERCEYRINELGKAAQALTNQLNLLALFIQRLNVLQGLEEPPEDWNITEHRVIYIAEETGIPVEEVREALIKNFGRDLKKQ